MNTEERFKMILAATPDQLSEVDAVLERLPSSTTVTDTRLLTFTDAAKALGLSRQTIWRMTNEGRIATIEIRSGRRRVPAAALTELVQKATVKQIKR